MQEQKHRSTCNVSFTRNDLARTKLGKDQCPVKNCTIDVKRYSVPYNQKTKVPFCPEHGIRIHTNGFVYYNGPSPEDLELSVRRNLMFHGDFYVNHFLGHNNRGNKIESGRLCYENSEDAVTYNVFSELLAHGSPLNKLASYLTGSVVTDAVELYLWGGKIDLENDRFVPYNPLSEVRKSLELDIYPFVTEPDIMLIVPDKVLICIEAKLGSKNPPARDAQERPGEKPQSHQGLIQRYCKENTIIPDEIAEIFDFSSQRQPFYGQIFRNIVFAAAMSKLEEIPEWYVVNLRNQHVMHLRQGRP